MFEFLFKYPSDYFDRGSLILALPWWQFALLPLAILVLGFIALGYFRVGGRLEIRHRGFIALLRSLAISLIIFSLSRPLLEVSAHVPQPNLVGILIDNSISMRIEDFAEGPRSDFISQRLDPANGNLLRSLRESFDTKLFKFGADTQLLTDINALDYGDGDSDLNKALNVVQESLKAEPLSGLVVISDGAIASSKKLDTTLLSLRAAGIPVHSIGVGQSQYNRDIEVTRINLPKKVLKGSRIVADVSINQQGYDGLTAELLVEDDSRILHKQKIRLKHGMQSVKIPLDTTESGPRQLKFYLADRADEQIAANNSNQGMLSVDNARMRILYFEGEPRFELKFIRRAVADDQNLLVTGLIRTADAKYYRVGIESRQELRDGFPITREELFSYHALILGSVETSLLSREQQEMIAEFVSQRGGGLLLLGGRHAFAEGGYRDTVLQDISPVVMADLAQPEFTRRVKIRPTAAGWVHPALLIADSSEKSMARWLTLPALTIVNPIQQIKPGATLLLTSSASEQDKPYVAMASQRYGRGKVVAFPVQNSWLWQMHHEIELQDQTHQTLWRQLLRWLVDSVPQRLSLSLSTDLIHSNGVIKLRSEVLGPNFKAHDQAQPRAILTAANGLEQIKSLTRDPALQGVYEAEISVASPGDYRVRVELDEKGKVISSDETGFKVSNEGSEYYQSEMNEKLLRRISSETRGDFFTPDSVDGLVDVLAAHQRGSTVPVRYELWDMPLLFLLLVLLLGTEWGYRRWQNLV
jgi:uncharacterized membrane protein